MQRYTIFFITVNALRVSGGFSAHHQEFKNCTHSMGICQACFLLPLVVVGSKLGIYPWTSNLEETVDINGKGTKVTW